MKKSLLAVAVAAALPLVAQAQTNVTMYGIADVGINFVNNGAVDAQGEKQGVNTRIDSGIQSTSRWGIRGTEDLGGGLSAIFNFEGQLNVDNGGVGRPELVGGAVQQVGDSSFQLSRRSFVGLQGGFGQIYFGRDYTPSFYAGTANDIFGFGLNGTTLTFNQNNGSTIRYSNGIYYASPIWGGFQLRAAYGAGEFATDSKRRGDSAEIGAFFNRAGLTLNGYFRQGWAGSFNSGLAPVADGIDPPRTRQYGIGGGYNFGMFRFLAQYAVNDPEDSALAPFDKDEMASIGIGIRLGAGELMGQAWQVRRKMDGEDPKANTFGIAYTHPLSKRTNIYASLGYTQNKSGASMALGNSANRYFAGIDARDGTATNPGAFAIGMRHQF